MTEPDPRGLAPRRLRRRAAGAHPLVRQRHVRPPQQRRLPRAVRQRAQRLDAGARPASTRTSPPPSAWSPRRAAATTARCPSRSPSTSGCRANRLGRTSVVFEFGVFLPDDEQIAAHGLWAQVYVDRETRRPGPHPGCRARAPRGAPSPRRRRERRPEHAARVPAPGGRPAGARVARPPPGRSTAVGAGRPVARGRPRRGRGHRPGDGQRPRRGHRRRPRRAGASTAGVTPTTRAS